MIYDIRDGDVIEANEYSNECFGTTNKRNGFIGVIHQLAGDRYVVIQLSDDGDDWSIGFEWDDLLDTFEHKQCFDIIDTNRYDLIKTLQKYFRLTEEPDTNMTQAVNDFNSLLQ